MTLFIAQINVQNKETYQRYIDKFYKVFKKYNGRIISVDDEPKQVEGEKLFCRVVVIRFPDESEFKKWYNSLEYQEIAELRWNSSDANIVLVEER
jgi:uncharacterized protein (DUF1330 family)